ncbi:MAG TPA: Na+/H+ antiporter subunit A [Actinocrinis sp.]|nr:Na+/H+ antiporter subunit A [Actinocrinis sp.]
MIWLVVLHGLAAAGAAPLVARWGRSAFLVLAAAPAAAFGWAVAQTPGVIGGGTPTQVYSWMPTFGVYLAFRLDALSLLLLYLAAGIGTLVLVFCARYFDDSEPGLGLFAGALTAFAGAMIGLVLADDLIVLFVFWELTTILSFLLIGHYAQRAEARRAAMQAVLVTTFGGLAMLGGVVLLGHAGGTYRISALLASPPHGRVVTVALVLVLVGALSKSAVFPFSEWLPGAMAAPTPVSAYLHAAAMVKAGVYLVARLAPAYGGDPTWRAVTTSLGAATMLLGGVRALREHDLKRVLAFGTVSQLGFLTAVLGSGTRDAVYAGLALLVAHALFKAPLFLSVGIIDRCAGTRDLRKLSGLRRELPWVASVCALACLSMAAVPLFLGFAAKESVFSAFVDAEHGGSTGDGVLLAVFTGGSGLTVAYTLRVWWGAFGDKAGVPDRPARPAAMLMLVPAGILAVAGLVLGVGARVLDPLLSEYANTVPGEHGEHLAAWHGFGQALGLSAVAWLVGAVVFAAREPLYRFHRRHVLPEAENVVTALVLATDRAATQITGAIQRGSLPIYVSTTFGAFAALGLFAIGYGAPWPSLASVRWWDNPFQVPLAVLIAVAALGAVFARPRLAGAMLVGVTGLGTALLFLLQGALDLSFTQLTAEIVSLVVFVLVLRRLGPVLRDGSRPGRRVLHTVIAVATGGSLAALTYLSAASRVQPAISSAYLQAAQRDHLGNVVSAIVLDYRAWDTLGESSVVAVAAAGVTSLVFLRRSAAALPRPSVLDLGAGGVVGAGSVGGGPGRVGGDTPVVASAGVAASAGAAAGGVAEARRLGPLIWLATAVRAPGQRRSLVLEVLARLTYHTVLLVSVYVLVHGEDGLGGGFVAGLLAGLALTLRYLAGGRYELAEAAPVDAGFLLGIGMFLSAGTALTGYLFGGALDDRSWSWHVPVLGEVHVSSTLFFDLGVYVLVVGLVLDILRSLGSEVDRHIAADRAAEFASRGPGDPR